MPSDSTPLPALGQQVRLRAADLSVICSVAASDARALTLSGPIEHPGGPAEVIFAHARGVTCLSGELTVAAAGNRFAVERSQLLEQRRETFRVPVSGRTAVTREDGTMEYFELKDLSVEGARVLSGTPMKLGEPLSLVLTLNGRDLGVSGRVARVDEGGYGIRFDQLARSDESLLNRYLVEQQRERVRTRD